MIELPTFTQFRTLAQAQEVMQRVGVENVGVVVDFWHFYASDTVPDDIAHCDPRRIFGVHFCDGHVPKQDEGWDETVSRDCMPGAGEIDLPAWSEAVQRSGYDCRWSIELISPWLWERDPATLLLELRRVLQEHITDALR